MEVTTDGAGREETLGFSRAPGSPRGDHQKWAAGAAGLDEAGA